MSGKNRRTRSPGVESRFWTCEDDAVLRRMFTAGDSYGKIANALGRTRSATIGRAKRIGLCGPGMRKPVVPPKPKPAPQAGASRTDLGRTNRSFARRPKDETLPHLTTRKGTRLHVYPPDPYALLPLATYEKSGDWWVQCGRPDQRYRTVSAAVKSLAP